MEEASSFNSKKARAQKLKRDKFHHKHSKHSDNGSTKAAKVDLKSSEKVTPLKDDGATIESSSQTTKSNLGFEAPPSNSKTYSKRVLASNWARYEKELDISIPESDEYSAANFEELVSLPITGGHFKLKHEYDWEKEREEIQAPWFRLDLQKLNNSLSTIPFFERQGLPSTLFSEEKLNQMKLRASQSSASLKDTHAVLDILKQDTSMKKDSEKTTKPVANVSVKTVESVDPICAKNSDESQCLEDKDLDKLLFIDEPHVIPAIVEGVEAISIGPPTQDKGTFITNEPTQSKVSSLGSVNQATPSSTSLDDWLDSILDD